MPDPKCWFGEETGNRNPDIGITGWASHLVDLMYKPKRRLAGVFVLALTVAPASALGAPPLRAAARALLEVSTMGVEIRIAPVDLRLYRERFLPHTRQPKRARTTARSRSFFAPALRPPRSAGQSDPTPLGITPG
jgi:hypothetical protein